MRMMGGNCNYETFEANATHSIPSLRTIDRFIESTKYHLVEGELRADELCTYLKKLNLPLCVSLSEDATRITGTVKFKKQLYLVSKI